MHNPHAILDLKQPIKNNKTEIKKISQDNKSLETDINSTVMNDIRA